MEIAKNDTELGREEEDVSLVAAAKMVEEYPGDEDDTRVLRVAASERRNRLLVLRRFEGLAIVVLSLVAGVALVFAYQGYQASHQKDTQNSSASNSGGSTAATSSSSAAHDSHSNYDSYSPPSSTASSTLHHHDESGKKIFTCPATELHVSSNNLEYDGTYYHGPSQEKAKHLDEYLNNFRDTEYDDWGYTYNEVKTKMYDWKVKHFSGLKSGDSLYESACGLGMNLLMTLEILQETTGVQGVVVYGNDYIEESVEIANVVAGQGHLPGGGKLGSLCHGDSTDLSFVPSNSMDLVYSGYITALYDPLGWNTTEEAVFREQKRLCRSHDPVDGEKRHELQKRQNMWFESWVTEMVRIAKPGAKIIIEQVQPPYCQQMHDYGGVSREHFWDEGAIRKHGWDVDPASVDIASDHIFTYSSRYHVAMRKNL